MLAEITSCWLALALSLVATVAIYRAECRLYGGVGMASLIAGAVILYNLVNPALYLIHPLLTPLFSLCIGFSQPVSLFLPNIIATAAFLVCLAVTTAMCRPIRNIGDARTNRAIPQSSLNSLVRLILVLSLTGLVFFAVRNKVAYGSWNGSFSADYTGATARPPVPLFSAYINLWDWAIQILSIVCLWQYSAGKVGRLAVFFPLLMGGLFAVTEGNRTLITTAVLIFVGWFGLQGRLTAKRILGGLLIVTLLTLLANARYHKGESTLSARISDMFAPEYFRPFWSSDPVGPALVTTLECWRSTTEGASFGLTYLRNLVAMTPKAIWPGRPDDSATMFAQWYHDREGSEWAPGTGFAFNPIAEACMNFWYFGPALLGLACGRVASRLTRWCAARTDLRGRCVFALYVSLTVLPMARCSSMVFVSPLMLLSYLLVSRIVRLCSPPDSNSAKPALSMS